MDVKNRADLILTMLTEETKVEVSALSERLGVSTVTIRKDLDALESRGIIKREHGFAVLANPNDISGRIAYHYEAKLRIAQKACQLVHDGETIMMESGSCCALMADLLAAQKKELTIVTNSAFIVDYIRRKANFQLVLLGGIYQPDAQVMVGPMVRQCAENFWVEHFFIGVDGYSDRSGFANQDQLRAQAVRDMARQAGEVVVLTESAKFARRGTVPLNLGGQVKKVITDERLAAETADRLSEEGTEVIFA